MNKKYVVYGGKKLNGTIKNQASKNSFLPIMAGAILSNKEVVLKNTPRLLDIENMIKILKDLGANVKLDEKKLYINSNSINKLIIDCELSKSLRSSIFILGPMLARFKKFTFSFPGGCDIGNRPIDLHLSGLRELGVKISNRHNFIICDATDIHSGTVNLNFPSVGATENLMMSAVFLEGETRLINVAKEPEIIDLQNFLNSLGCNISGAGSSEIIIKGVKECNNFVEYDVIGDRITAGTYLIACAMCGGHVIVENINPNHLNSLINKLLNIGCKIKTEIDSIEIFSNGELNAIDLIETSVYPGFPTDLQSQIMAMLSVSKGVSIIIENIFENRFKFACELRKMGANIYTKERVAVVRGVDNLIGANVDATDLRGGAGLILAGLKAEGYTTINNIFHIERGYENIDRVLNSIGADIRLIEG